MNEQPNFAVTKTYSLTMVQIAKVADLAELLQVSQGEVVRRAIDMFYEKISTPQAETHEQPAR